MEDLPELCLAVLYRHYRETGSMSLSHDQLEQRLRKRLPLAKGYIPFWDVTHIMIQRGWVKRKFVYSDGVYDVVADDVPKEVGESAEYVVRYELLPQGIDCARVLLRPWHGKLWDLFRGDLRTIVVSVITATLVTLMTLIIRSCAGP